MKNFLYDEDNPLCENYYEGDFVNGLKHGIGR